MNLFDRLAAAGVFLRLEGEKVVYRAHGGALAPPLLAELRARRAELVRILKDVGVPPTKSASSDERTGAPLSAGQQRIWFMDRLSPGRGTYNIPLAFALEGAFPAHAFEHAMGQVVQRHEVLRTHFISLDGSPIAEIEPPAPVIAALVDLSGLPSERCEHAIRLVLEATARRPFDLERGPVFRVAWLRRARDEEILTFTVHHAAFDGWSMNVLSNEVERATAAFISGAPSLLPPVPFQYGDFAREQLGRPMQDAVARRGYWRAKLAGLPPSPWPSVRGTVTGQPGISRQLVRLLPSALLSRLRAHARKESCTLFVIALGALEVALKRHGGTDDFAVGTDLAGRDLDGSEAVIGFFAEQVALRSDLSHNPSLRELSVRISRTLGEAFSHVLGYDSVVSLLSRNGESSDQLFRVKLVLQPPGELPLLPGVRVKPVPIHVPDAKFHVLLNLFMRGDALVCAMDFDVAVLSLAEATSFLDEYGCVLEFFCDRPEAHVSDVLAALDDSDRTRRQLERKEFRALRSRLFQTVTSSARGGTT